MLALDQRHDVLHDERAFLDADMADDADHQRIGMGESRQPGRVEVDCDAAIP